MVIGQTTDVAVNAGDEVTVELPCSEMLGVGPLEMPGQPGCHLADGQTVPNTLTLPGFIGMDYGCGGDFMFRMMADVNDLDGDGNVEELIIVSQSMSEHMQHGFSMGAGSMMGS